LKWAALAIVRLRKGTKIIHQEAKTFTHRAAAEKRAKSGEVALENPVGVSISQAPLAAANLTSTRATSSSNGIFRTAVKITAASAQPQ